MAAPQKAPLRPLTVEEAAALRRLVAATSARHDRRQRAVALGAVAGGATFQAAAAQAGYRRADTVGALVRRFNARGLGALEIAAGRGRPAQYGPAERTRILEAVRRAPDRRADATATWSLKTLEQALREAGLGRLSATTIRQVLREAGYRFQRTRTWCPTGTARRRRASGVVDVVDPAAEQKRAGSSRHTAGRRRRG